MKTKGKLGRLAVLALSAALVTSTFMVGCSNTSNGSSGGKKVDLTFWHPYGGEVDKGAIEKAVTQFNGENSDINVKAEFIGGSGAGSGITDKLTTAISGGNPPDLVIFDRFMVGQWASQDLFEDITDNIKSAGITSNQFYQFAWDEATYKGKQYALPFDTDARALFYNKDMFKEAGLDPEQPPKTIAELESYAEKLTVKDGNRYKSLGFFPWDGQGFLYTWGWSFGGQFQDKATGKITANDPKIVEALEWEASYAKKYGIDTITNFATAAGNDLSPFAAKLVGMTVTGPWDIAGFKKNAPDLNFGIAPIPCPDGQNFATWAGGWSLAVPKGAKHKNEALKLAQFFSVGDGAKIYGEDTVHFMSASALNADFGWVKNEPRAKVFVDSFPKAFCRPVISQGQLLWDELATATDNALHGKGEPKQLLEDVTNKVNKALGN